MYANAVLFVENLNATVRELIFFYSNLTLWLWSMITSVNKQHILEFMLFCLKKTHWTFSLMMNAHHLVHVVNYKSIYTEIPCEPH